MRFRFRNNPHSLILGNSSGLTLIEILISMGILVFISFAIYQATVQTFRLRDSLSSEGQFYNSIRISMTLMQRDIALMYSPITTLPRDKRPNTNAQTFDPNGQPIAGQNLPPPVDARTMQLYMNDGLNQPTDFWSAAIDNNGIRPARFKGTENKITFISASHIRIYKDAPESEFAKVTYELKRDDKNKNAPPGSNVLVKTETPNAFSNDQIRDTMVHSYELLHGIKKMTYSYLQRDGTTWKKFTTWDSEREDTKYRYPDVIEVTLEVIGERRENFEGKYRFKPEIPINGLYPSM